MRREIKDSRSFLVGWAEEDSKEVKYFGNTQGFIGRYDKASGYWFWIKGPNAGRMGPRGDIGYSAVLEFERAR